MSVKIMLDTDIGGDCDDAGAIALLHSLAKRGECEILSVTHCFKNEYYAGCIDAINTYFGREDIPVGAFPPDSDAEYFSPDTYGKEIACEFPNKFGTNGKYPSTVDVMRSVLENSADNEVTLVSIGPLHSLAAILKNHRELVEKKVCRTVIMGGRFESIWHEDCGVTAEYNISKDTEASQYVCDNWPGEIVFCSFETGVNIITASTVEQKSDNNPISRSYRIWHEKCDEVHKNTFGRSSWDLVTVLFAVRGCTDLWKLHPYGKVNVDDNGITTWQNSSDFHHTILLEKADNEIVRKTIDELLEEII